MSVSLVDGVGAGEGVVDVGFAVSSASLLPDDMSVAGFRRFLSAFHWPDLYAASDTTTMVAEKIKSLRRVTRRERMF